MTAYRDTAELIVRRATSSDLPTLVEWNLRLARESESLELDPTTVATGVRAVLEDPVKGVYFLADLEGRAVGQLMVTVEWSDWRNGPIWWLQSVYVDSDFRGRGVFRALFAEILEAAALAGVPSLRLYVEEGNLGAQEVYRKVGMRPAGYRVFEVEP